MMNIFTRNKPDVLSTSDSDPFNPDVFPDEIQQMILEYLPVKELLSACLTSKLWNITIGSSMAFKRRVSIKIHPWSRELGHDLVGSQRRYENLSVVDFELKTRTLACIVDKDWKNVTLSVGKIKTQAYFIKVLERFSTVRELRILSTNIRELSRVHPIALPELETLAFSDVTLDLFDLFIATHPNLKNLSLRFIGCDILSPRGANEAIVDFLVHNPQLKDLEVNHLISNDLFNLDVSSKTKLQLRCLTLGLHESPALVQQNIVKLVQSQGSSLEHLKLVLHQKFERSQTNNWGYWNRTSSEHPSDDFLIILKSWNSLTSLRSLSIRFLGDSLELEDIQELVKSLKQSTNLTSLHIQHSGFAIPASVIEILMKLSPSLNSFYVTKLTPAVVRFATLNLRALRSLTCTEFTGECIREYNELKSEKTNANKLIVVSERSFEG